MLPIVSASLTMARVLRGMTMFEVAAIAGVNIDEVLDAENFLDNADQISVHLIAMALDVDLTKLTELA